MLFFGIASDRAALRANALCRAVSFLAARRATVDFE
jgi:hypothetical protein